MTQLASDAIERLELYEDHAVLGDLTFALEGAHDLAERPDAFLLHKSRAQLDEYVDLFRAFPSFAPEHVLELGIWNGGSTVMWFELFRPRKHVAVDIADRGDDEAFRRFVDDRGAEERLQTYWSTDQADARRMQQIVALSFAQPPDLVIDDASHLYEPTKSSFEALFPLLAEGGKYVVEDWPWGQLAHYRDRSHPWSRETPLTELLVQLVRAVAGAPEIVRRIHVYYAFFVVERGPAVVDPLDFSLDELAGRLR